MSSEDFVHVYTGPGGPVHPSSSHARTVAEGFFKNSRGDRQWTEGFIVESLRIKHPEYHITVSPSYSTDLIAFANANSQDATYSPHGDIDFNLIERQFLPPARRYNDENGGYFAEKIVFGAYDYNYKGTQFLVYIVEGADGAMYKNSYVYVLIEDPKKDKILAQAKTDDLLAAAARYAQELHDEVLVFDQGYWQKSKDLWLNVQKSNWEDVILEKEKKEAMIEDVLGFFNAEERYKEFGIPWKRGVIFYGPPGNGKTISTKALMHDISKRVAPKIESLYVKTFTSFGGPEYSIRQIFLTARQMAPCLLIFEDIDSLVSPMVRSYFLNEVDGLESNHGILMIGSTNHLEQLDPGIAKRPSRFDRKYLFDNPTRDERVQYSEYWRHKLRNNKKIDFPKEMCSRIADITSDFSFAYMKEAFVAALLVIVAKGDEKRKFRRAEDDLSGNILWKELKRQVENLRKEMDEESEQASPSMSGMWPALQGILDERGARPMDINTSMPRYF